MSQTTLNYTGQRLDATGLLYYHARYYNPLLARFISADSVVPGNASGGMAGVALKGLTVDFHEPGFAAQIGGENNVPFWFQLSDDDKQKVGSPWGPRNPQALNRYSYVLNGPMRWTDPSGHDTRCDEPGCGGVVYNHTNHSIWVVGSVKGPCPGGDPSATVCENVMVEVRAGESSADAGVLDADAVAVANRSGHKVSGYKILDPERADVYEGQDGSTIIEAGPKMFCGSQLLCLEDFIDLPGSKVIGNVFRIGLWTIISARMAQSPRCHKRDGFVQLLGPTDGGDRP